MLDLDVNYPDRRELTLKKLLPNLDAVGKVLMKYMYILYKNMGVAGHLEVTGGCFNRHNGPSH